MTLFKDFHFQQVHIMSNGMRKTITDALSICRNVNFSLKNEKILLPNSHCNFPIVHWVIITQVCIVSCRAGKNECVLLTPDADSSSCENVLKHYSHRLQSTLNRLPPRFFWAAPICAGCEASTSPTEY